MTTKILKVLVIVLFILGLLATGLIGTETRAILFWPGCALLALAGLVAGLRWRWRLKFMPSDACLATALVFGLYLLVRQITSPVFAYAREDMMLLMACAVAYTLGATVLSDPRSRTWLLVVVALLTLGNTVVAAFHHSGNWTFHILQKWYERPFYENRVGGFFVNPNHLASFFAMSSLLLAATAIFGRGGAAWKLVLGFVSLIAALGIALTMSRGGLLGLAAGGATLAVAGVYVLCKTQRHLLGKVLAGIAVLCLLGGVMLYGVFSEQLQKRLGGAGFSEGDPRPHIWRAALAQNAEQPLLGAGARMFYDGCVTHRTPDSPPWMKEAFFAHNEWLQMLADYGWVGLLLAVLMFGTHLANLVRYLRWFVNEKFPHTATLMSSGLGLVLGAFAALMALLAHAIFEFNFHVPVIAVVASCLLGICANPGCTPVGSSPRRVPGVRLALKVGLIVLPVVLLCGLFKYGRADYFAEKADLAGSDDDSTPVKLEALSKAIALDPSNASLWHRRGTVRITAASGQPVDLARSLAKRAAADLTEARRLNPQSLPVALELADALMFIGEADKSLEAIQAALALAPLYEEPRLALASYYLRTSQWQKSEEAFFFASEARAGKTGKWFEEYQRMLVGAAAASK